MLFGKIISIKCFSFLLFLNNFLDTDQLVNKMRIRRETINPTQSLSITEVSQTLSIAPKLTTNTLEKNTVALITFFTFFHFFDFLFF